jgi:uncharacterized protein (TIGR02284 family)
VTGSDDDAVIAEVDRGESYLNGKWEAALSDDGLSTESRALVQQLYTSVRSGHERWERAHDDTAAS